MDTLTLLASSRIVPVVVVDDPSAAVGMAHALHAGGLGAVEITLRTEAALPAIEAVAGAVPELMVGAGSVLDPQQFDQAVAAGAQFIVSPGSSAALVEHAAAQLTPWIPGAVTATEIMQLRAHGYTLQKFFPAELAGGTAQLAALSAPIPDVRFFPTGGIKPANAMDYLALTCVACLGGTWITPRDVLGAGRFDQIAALARDAAQLACMRHSSDG